METPISSLNKVGKASSAKLKRISISSVKDLLFHFPFRYEDYSKVLPIRDLREGESATIKAKVELIGNRRTRFRKSITEALLSDESGSLRAVWFNQPFLTKYLLAGKVFYFSGTVKGDMLGPQLINPAYESENKANINTGRLVPMYPLTQGLTQKQIRFLVQQVLPETDQMKDWVPKIILEENNLLQLSEALKGIHFPANQENLKKAEERLKFNELFLVQLQAELSRMEKQNATAPSLNFKEQEVKDFVAALPFSLTKSQKLSAWEIIKNIGESTPMNRLLSGDVGSGKTIVAALSLFNTVLNGFQAVLMAPTEILAAQHFSSVTALLPKRKIALFTRSQKIFFNSGNREEVGKTKLSKLILDGEAEIVIGTHALLGEGVNFSRLGLVIVDEQHRFGVVQRKVIKEKGEGVHFLSMTATPIPRSLALMLYGDLDISIINELPPGRKMIKTKLVEPNQRASAYAFIREQVKKGGQIFVVCPLIEENNLDNLEKKSVISEYNKLSEKIFPDLRISFLHGKMKPHEKEGVMDKFKNKEFDILVSTSVIEVGVDIPNATVMMVEGSDRFGLAQLHQFRGRVGRGDKQSYCLLFTDSINQRTLERLRYFESHNDGFKLAEKDLEIRGPGEVYGVAQSGMMQLRLAKLTDKEIIKKAREASKVCALRIKDFPELEGKLEEVKKTLHLE